MNKLLILPLLALLMGQQECTAYRLKLNWLWPTHRVDGLAIEDGSLSHMMVDCGLVELDVDWPEDGVTIVHPFGLPNYCAIIACDVDDVCSEPLITIIN